VNCVLYVIIIIYPRMYIKLTEEADRGVLHNLDAAFNMQKSAQPCSTHPQYQSRFLAAAIIAQQNIQEAWRKVRRPVHRIFTNETCKIKETPQHDTFQLIFVSIFEERRNRKNSCHGLQSHEAICCFFVSCMLCFLAMYVHFLYVRPIFVTLPPGISVIAVNK
jgi:hypothetical protein